MFLLDLSHTSHTRARTGIQRVCRSLYVGLHAAGSVQPITFDPFEKNWRNLQRWEMRNLRSQTPSHRRGAHWPWSARWLGRLRRRFSAPSPRVASAKALIVPEIFSAQNARHFPALFRTVTGPRIALFHDAIALKLPELTPAKTIARFPEYLRELLKFDAIAAVSEDSRQSLLDYWQWLGIQHPPIVQTIPLGIAPSVTTPATPTRSGGSTVLSVGSIEGRKNHLTLLQSCEILWHEGLNFDLRLIGLCHRETGVRASQKISEFQAAGRPLRYDGPVSEAVLEQAYSECAFTVYPSLMEGFGLPVLESVARGKPCICSAFGALGEATQGGGCLTCAVSDVGALAAAIKSLLLNDELRTRLATEAATRIQRTEQDFARDLLDWIVQLQSKPGTRSFD